MYCWVLATRTESGTNSQSRFWWRSHNKSYRPVAPGAADRGEQDSTLSTASGRPLTPQRPSTRDAAHPAAILFRKRFPEKRLPVGLEMKEEAEPIPRAMKEQAEPVPRVLFLSPELCVWVVHKQNPGLFLSPEPFSFCHRMMHRQNPSLLHAWLLNSCSLSFV